MENQVLSIEQMNRLKEFGVDVKPKGKCLMYSSDSSDDYYLKYGESTCEDDIKAFTIYDLIEILPKYITLCKKNYFLEVQSVGYFKWSVGYYCGTETLVSRLSDTLIESLYDVCILLIEVDCLKTK